MPPLNQPLRYIATDLMGPDPRTLVLTDTNILDGAFFLADLGALNGVSRFRNELPPVEVRSRASDPEGALMGMIRRNDADKLTGFVFSSIASNRDEVAKELKKIKVGAVSGMGDLLRELKYIGVDRENICQIESGWRKAKEAVCNGWLVWKPWAPPDLSLFQKTVDDELSIVLERGRISLKHAEFVELKKLVARMQSSKSRSAVDSVVKEFMAGGSDMAIKMASRMYSSYNICYNRSLSAQHGCDSYEYTAANQFILNSFDGGLGAVNEVEDIPPALLRLLGTMPHEAYVTIATTKCMMFEQWWQNGEVAALLVGLADFLDQAAALSVGGDWIDKFWPVCVNSDICNVTTGAAEGIDIKALESLPQLPVRLAYAESRQNITHRLLRSASRVTPDGLIGGASLAGG